MGNDGKKIIQLPYSLTVRELAGMIDTSPNSSYQSTHVEWRHGKH